MKQEYGPSREYICVLETPNGQIAAGFNFVSFPMATISDLVTIHSLYVFVVPEWRGYGLLRKIYQMMADIGKKYAIKHCISSTPQVLFFGEQNDPFRMTVGAYRFDTEMTGIDQFSRIAIWNHLGARIVIFPYIQPPLSKDAKPDKKLFLRVIFQDEYDGNQKTIRYIDPKILLEHLRRLFTFPIMKGSTKKNDIDIFVQFELLQNAINNRDLIKTIPLPTSQILAGFKQRATMLSEGCASSSHMATLFGINSMIEAVDVQI